MHLAGSSDQGAEHHRGCARVIEGGVGRRYVEAKFLYQSSQARRLPLGQLQHESCERRSVDDRVLQRTFEPASDQPAVKGIVAVLD